MTRLADRLAAAGHITRGRDPGHRSVVTLELTPTEPHLVRRLPWSISAHRRGA